MTFEIPVDQLAGDGTNREILEVDIPIDADPGLIYNNHIMDNGRKSVKYEYDYVFDSTARQEDVYNVVARDRVRDALYHGINCSILGYGQTGSGKTYSICGGDSYADRGLIPRTISMIFSEVKHKHRSQTEKNPSEIQIISLRCQVTFVEIYKDVIYDLLPPLNGAEIEDSGSFNRSIRSRPGESLPIVQVLDGPSDEKGVNQLVLKNINVYEPSSEEEALSLYFLGMKNRNTSSTSMNISSSRSHAVFTAVVETETIQDGKKVFSRGKVNLVDLAGSERVFKVSLVPVHRSLTHQLCSINYAIEIVFKDANIRGKGNQLIIALFGTSDRRFAIVDVIITEFSPPGKHSFIQCSCSIERKRAIHSLS
jgi:hypothetical protein